MKNEALIKRAPKGYDMEHLLIEDLKRKDFIALCRLDEEAALAPDFRQTCAKQFKVMAPLTAFLCKAVGVPF